MKFLPDVLTCKDITGDAPFALNSISAAEISPSDKTLISILLKNQAAPIEMVISEFN